MNSFKDAFVRGIQEAEDAAANTAEINDVLAELTNSISESSNGKIKLSVKTRTVIEEQEPNFAIDALQIESITASLYKSPKKRHYKALIAKSCKVESSHEREICEWELSDSGYPVHIDGSGYSSSFNDKESLVQGLSRLISKPAVGKIFKELMDL